MLDFKKTKDQFLDEKKVDQEGIASDTTGFSPGQASLYYQTRMGRLYQRWAKGVYSVGTASQFILAWRSGWGPGSDVAYLSGLRRDSRRYGHYQGKRKAWVMMADSGFDGQTVQHDDQSLQFGVAAISSTLSARHELIWFLKHAWMVCLANVGRPKR